MYVRSKSGISLIVLSKYQSYNIVSAATCATVLLEPVQVCSWRGQAVFCLLQREIRRRPDTNLPNTGSGLQIKQPVTERGDTFKQAISDSDL